MKKLSMLVIFMVLFSLIISCDYTNNSENKDNSDSIEKVNIQSELYNDSINNIADSIKNAKYREESINKIKSSIKVTSVYLSDPNSASGCDLYFYFKNISDSTIKYLTFSLSFYNNVDDIVTCEIRDNISYGGRITGPIKSGQSDGGCWSCAIYNYSATKVKLYYIEVEYINGSKLRIEGRDLMLIGIKKNKIIE